MPTDPQLKPWIEELRPYVPGKSKSDDGRTLIKLSANENPLGCSPAALDALRDPGNPADYPDPGALELTKAIGKLHGIDPALIVCGTGSGELLHCAVQAYAGPGDEVLFSQYSFSLYPLITRKVGAVPVAVKDENFVASVDAILAAVTDKTRVVLLDNPNNPCGTHLARDEVRRLHQGLPGNVLLVLDQAYAEYVDDGMDDDGLVLAWEASNVLVTRTFSKAYGLAGLRIGWATGAPAIVAGLQRLRGAFNVSTQGQNAACAALADQEFVERSRQANARGRQRLIEAVQALGNHGLRAIPSQANFVLVLFEGEVTAEAALKVLADAGYAVRNNPSPALPDALRITIGSEQHMDDVIATLRQLCGEAA
ncbi:pyridoxal phosphate-dependent aminotransferase [Altererythrobacter sp. GH1-8]|uniref:pyridoxal phosphate-dependent aminotransferase n=1 Tax=Altererythrobacter sp. GH1-8 TaxID=3349333 RepID=UPI00374DBB8A